MNWNLVKLVGVVLLAGAAMLVVLPACSSATGATAPTPTPPQTTATPGATATSAPAVAPAPTSSAGPSNSDLLALGKSVFEKTAGGVGCAHCHGLDGKGQGPAQVNAPNIRGKNEGDVRTAIQGGVSMMSFIKMSDQEITAVVAYLRYLANQP